MPDEGAPSVYRDGQHPALARFRERRRQVEAMATSLRADGWRSLPRDWRNELEQLGACVVDPRPELDAVAAAEAALEAYAERLEDALALVANLRARRQRDAPVRRRLLRGSAIAAATITVGVGVWVYLEGRRYEVERAAFAAECLAGLECRDDGRCAAGSDSLRPNHFACVARSDAECAASRRACPEEGRCRVSGTRCAALDDADCARSKACADRGDCVATGDYWCHSDEEHCQARPGCTNDGLCQPGTNQHGCWVSELGCRASAVCRERGACSMVDSRCGARMSEDCWESDGCKEYGACEAVEGKCVRRRPAVSGSDVQIGR